MHAHPLAHTRIHLCKLTKTDNRSCNYTVAVQPRVNNAALKRHTHRSKDRVFYHYYAIITSIKERGR